MLDTLLPELLKTHGAEALDLSSAPKTSLNTKVRLFPESLNGVLTPRAKMLPNGLKRNGIPLASQPKPELDLSAGLNPELLKKYGASPSTKARTSLKLALNGIKRLEKELLKQQRLGGGELLGLGVAAISAKSGLKLAYSAMLKLAVTNKDLALEHRKELDKLMKRFTLQARKAKKLHNERQKLKQKPESKRNRDLKQELKSYKQWFRSFGGTSKADANKGLVLQPAAVADVSTSQARNWCATDNLNVDNNPVFNTAAAQDLINNMGANLAGLTGDVAPSLVNNSLPGVTSAPGVTSPPGISSILPTPSIGFKRPRPE